MTISLKAEVADQCHGHRQMSLCTGLTMSLVQEFPEKKTSEENYFTIYCKRSVCHIKVKKKKYVEIKVNKRNKMFLLNEKYI